MTNILHRVDGTANICQHAPVMTLDSGDTLKQGGAA